MDGSTPKVRHDRVQGKAGGPVGKSDRWTPVNKLCSVPVLPKHPAEKGALSVTFKAFSLAFDRGEYSVFTR